ncbi:MAG: hypothetical protein WKF78_03950 [Candidatus Limnocylindrales bacterium]
MIAGTTTVHVHDGGEEIVPDGRRLYTAETLRMTAWAEAPERAGARRPCRLSLAGTRFRWHGRPHPDRDRRGLAAVEHDDGTASPCAWPSPWTASPSSSGPGPSAWRATSS